MAWQRLGEIPPSRLTGARRQAHWAAQVLSAAGETFLAHAPDTSHTAMSWDARQLALAGREVPGPAPCRVALRLTDLRLLLMDHRSDPVTDLALPGRTLAEAYRWTAAAVKTHTRGVHDRALVHPGYELDVAPLAGERFERDPGLPELARWYSNAAAELARFERSTPDAGEVLCWPHHFDLASLVVLETDREGEALRSVGIGFSPGDSLIAEPYWYVNHDPESERTNLPALAAGEWFRGEWTGALLRARALVAAGDAGAQEERLRSYLASAFSASRTLALETALE